LIDLPSSPTNKTGWMWTEVSPQLPDPGPDSHLWPRITIVTPSFNQGRFLEETIRSILFQGYPHLEYIIIDGGSNDNSVDIIKKYEPYLAYWVSEKDRGQAHAINKGFARASGDIYAYLNSDDFSISLSTVHFTVAPKLSEPAINGLLVKFSAGRKESGIGLSHNFLGKVSPNGF
jgi:hypothetical protein